MKEGYFKLQDNPERVVCLDGSGWNGWLFERHPDGQLVSCQKLEAWEIMQAEDQIDSGIVLDGGHNIISASGVRCG